MKCRLCGHEGLLEDFEKDGKRRRSRCRKCSNERARDYYARHTDERRAKAKEYEKTYARPRRKNIPYAEKKRLFPEKTRAQVLVGIAVESGKLVRPAECSECGGSAGRIHGHHEDYSRPLDVEWLCHDCHMKRHRKYP